MVQLTTTVQEEEGRSAGSEVKSEYDRTDDVAKEESGGTAIVVKCECAESLDSLSALMKTLSVDKKSSGAQASQRHPSDESIYALDIVDGVVPEPPVDAPKVGTYHDGSWFVISVGFRVGIFPYWHEVKVLVDGCPGNAYKKYRSYAHARAAFETARARNIVVEKRREVSKKK